MRKLLPFVILCTVLCGAALAADVPSPDADASGWLKALYAAATGGEWKVLAGLVLLGVMFAARTWGAKVVPWFATKTGGLVLAFVISLAGTMGLALAAGAAVSLATVVSALGTAAAAAGVWEWVKTYLPSVQASNDKTKTEAAAKTAASA